MSDAPRGPALRAPARAVALLVGLAACSPDPTSAAGHLVDARTRAPVPDAAVRLTAHDDKCPPVDVRTDAEGRWAATGLCGEARWEVAPADSAWYLPTPLEAGPDVEIAAWRAPPSHGVYVVSGAVVTPVLTHTVLDTVRIFDTTEEVRFPVEIPGVVPRLVGTDALLVVGDTPADLAFAPLVPSPERRWFGTKETPQPIDPWVYLGVRFTSDTAFERVSTAVEAGKITTVGGERPLRYVAADALPAGRYALPNAEGTRAWLFDFGAAP